VFNPQIEEKMKIGDWVQTREDVIDHDAAGALVAHAGGVGHVLAVEALWATVLFDRTGRTYDVQIETLTRLCDYSGRLPDCRSITAN
jgi:hypothetical protein